MHRAFEKRVLVAKGRRISLLLVRERSRNFYSMRISGMGLRPSEPRPYQGPWPAKTDDMFPFPSTCTYKAGLLAEARISKLWDTTSSIVSGTCTDAVCSSLRQHEPGEVMKVPGCCTSTYYFADGPHGLGLG